MGFGQLFISISLVTFTLLGTSACYLNSEIVHGDENMRIELGLDYNPIRDQLLKQGAKINEEKVTLADTMLNYINHLRLEQIIDNKCAKKAYKNLGDYINRNCVK
ncbi:MAG: hypothetical protein A4E24_01026 [Methanomethylovorans sp. PtaU1.Bin093]|uniref:hypothetical protein n=1 Tax=Methanomethylovorans sp. PtaU1.Bin093 TaxID=1811679 RepID=UPI0009C4B819|nr:hypothetical protein [Methanomethylovorans sp. PtaU1.Bin093]OPY20692.1 MAG: hypothetical protein A4E24_01026 [Methanomethylovorans sp. PtaU1.Bin093]